MFSPPVNLNQTSGIDLSDLPFWISSSVGEQATVTHSSEWSPLHRRQRIQLQMEPEHSSGGPSHKHPSFVEPFYSPSLD